MKPYQKNLKTSHILWIQQFPAPENAQETKIIISLFAESIKAPKSPYFYHQNEEIHQYSKNYFTQKVKKNQEIHASQALQVWVRSGVSALPFK